MEQRTYLFRENIFYDNKRIPCNYIWYLPQSHLYFFAHFSIPSSWHLHLPLFSFFFTLPNTKKMYVSATNLSQQNTLTFLSLIMISDLSLSLSNCLWQISGRNQKITKLILTITSKLILKWGHHYCDAFSKKFAVTVQATFLVFAYF